VGTKYTLDRVTNFTGLDHAGYAFLSEDLPGTLVLNRFGAAPFFSKSQVTLLNLTSGAFDDIARNIDWPNVATIVGEEVFGFKAAVVGSGFLVPSHTLGGVWVVEASARPEVLKSGPVKITKDKEIRWKPDSGWFYHKAEVVDMNGDGLLDIVTSRCADSVEPFNSKLSELLWLEQPKTGALDGTPWVEHHIQEGPDFLFEVAPQTLTGAELGVCAAEYIGERLIYVHGSTAGGYATRVIDDELGHGFGCTWVDLNGDGKLDLLATNHVNQDGSVFAYSWDGNLSNSATSVRKHVLATGFSAVSRSAGQAAPGDAIPFFAEPGNTSGKPMILVSADNGNAIYGLVPARPNDPTDWTYTKQLLSYIGADVGRIAIGDTDRDGFNEFFVPAYDHGQVVHFKIRPTAGPHVPAVLPTVTDVVV